MGASSDISQCHQEYIQLKAGIVSAFVDPNDCICVAVLESLNVEAGDFESDIQ